LKIFLLRHGETEWSVLGKLQGHTDIPLSERGMNQIDSVGDFFVRTNEKIDVIITSPLIRAKKSAEIVAYKIGYPVDNIITEANFIERCFGRAEGLNPEERKTNLEGIDWNAESVHDLCKRADAINKYVNEYFGKTLLVTAHGSIIKAILLSLTKGLYSYEEGRVIFSTGEFCLVEHSGGAFNIAYERKNAVEALSML